MKKLLFVLLFPITVHAQKDYPMLLDKYMKAAADVYGFNGSVLVARSGKVIYQKSIGYRDEAHTGSLTPTSRFEIGMITDWFTAAGILLLKEQGKLSLTGTLRKFFPELPYQNITIRNMLTCTSGLPDYYETLKTRWDSNRMASSEDLVRILARDKPAIVREPGIKWDWDGTAFVLLGRIIEKVSGLSYSDFMQRNIFIPLELSHTNVFTGYPAAKRGKVMYAEGIYKSYIQATGTDTLKEPLPLLYAVVYGMPGEAGVNSTAADLYAWERALKSNRLLSKPTQQQMFAREVAIDSASHIYYGLGVRHGKNELGNFILQQEPGIVRIGYTADMISYTDKDIVIIVLCNDSKEFTSTQISGGLAYIMHDREVVLPYRHTEVAIDTAVLNNYIGKYALPNVVEIIKKNGKLYRRIPGEQEDAVLFAESPTKFFSDPIKEDLQYEFVTDNTGKVMKAYLIVRGMKKEIRKL